MAKEKKEKKQNKKTDKLVDEISKLTVLELSELVNDLQEKLGVTAMPQATAVAAQPQSDEAKPDDTQAAGATQTVILTAVGDNKIAAIKAIREIDQNIGLKEAKDMTESLPAEIAKDLKPEEAKDAAEKLKKAGCSVEFK
jgi:large subunit ribosomal protein L7/L12